MIQVLGRSLEAVRIVIDNDINVVYVCKEGHGEELFYTLISIKDRDVQKNVLKLLTQDDSIKENKDYVGHFVLKDTLNLLFYYKKEQCLFTYLDLYGDSFKKQVYIAKTLINACVGTRLPYEIVHLLLDEKNINLNPEGTVYFNYFIDFKNFNKLETSNQKLDVLAGIVFKILAKDYEEIYNVEKYPKDLRLFYKKLQADGFTTYNQLYKYTNLMPEYLEKEKGFWYKLKRIIQRIQFQFKKYSFPVVLLIIVGITFLACFDAFKMRYEAKQEVVQKEEIKETYDGLYTIGTVEIQPIENEEK